MKADSRRSVLSIDSCGFSTVVLPQGLLHLYAFKHHTRSAQNNFYIWKISHYDVAKRVLVAILAASCSMSLSWSQTPIMTYRNSVSR